MNLPVLPCFRGRPAISLLTSVIFIFFIGLGITWTVQTSEAAGVFPVTPPVKTQYSIKNDACLFSWDCLWDWQRNLRKVVGEHQVGYPSLGRIEIVTHDVIVELPEGTNHIDFGLYLVHAMRACKTAYESIGLRSDAGHPLELYLSINPRLGDFGYCCSLSPRGAPSMVFTYRSPQSLEDELRRVGLPTLNLADFQCRGDHELAHWFTYNTHFGWFMNEGFARYMDYSQQNPERVSPYHCYPNGYQDAPDAFGGKITPYIDLHILTRRSSEHTLTENSELSIAHYCFWKRIEQLYGRSTIAPIVEQQRRAPRIPYVNNFSDLLHNIRTAVIPVVGEGFYGELAGFGIYPGDFASVR